MTASYPSFRFHPLSSPSALVSSNNSQVLDLVWTLVTVLKLKLSRSQDWPQSQTLNSPKSASPTAVNAKRRTTLLTQEHQRTELSQSRVRSRYSKDFTLTNKDKLLRTHTEEPKRIPSVRETITKVDSDLHQSALKLLCAQLTEPSKEVRNHKSGKSDNND